MKWPVASSTKEDNLRLAKRPLKTNGRLANRGLTSEVKEAKVGYRLAFLRKCLKSYQNFIENKSTFFQAMARWKASNWTNDDPLPDVYIHQQASKS